MPVKCGTEDSSGRKRQRDPDVFDVKATFIDSTDQVVMHAHVQAPRESINRQSAVKEQSAVAVTGSRQRKRLASRKRKDLHWIGDTCGHLVNQSRVLGKQEIAYAIEGSVQ